ncbi:helix-turn-helix transcriptional regulator [Providencia rustigianii]|uniref:helix-turn-helix transcriptional regulator n=1 Tax=Providencia rustigianii TaxID=158850 RepID=UPI000D96D7DE|nr:helix-turn-helix transcriptional regulator [Providencia rustigianii]SPY78166.1 RapGH repressor [Providencia rustigianii]
MTINDSIAKRLIELRAEKGLSQSELAKMAGIAPAQISRYESGNTIPRANVLAKLAEALCVQFSYLAYGHGMDLKSMLNESETDENGNTRVSIELNDEELEIAKKVAEIRGMKLEEYLKWLVMYGLVGPK